jgi:FMN phosphatase YigB (HAD superfamily)
VSAPRASESITSVTFDFWNTLYSADHGAMDAVRPRRQQALRDLLASGGVTVTDEALTEAYQLGFQAYLAAWHDGLHFGAPDQVRFRFDCNRFPVVNRSQPLSPPLPERANSGH